MLSHGLQAVYDLRTWETPEQRANLFCLVVEDLLDTVAHALEEEEPAPVWCF